MTTDILSTPLAADNTLFLVQGKDGAYIALGPLLGLSLETHVQKKTVLRFSRALPLQVHAEGEPTTERLSDKLRRLLGSLNALNFRVLFRAPLVGEGEPRAMLSYDLLACDYEGSRLSTEMVPWTRTEVVPDGTPLPEVQQRPFELILRDEVTFMVGGSTVQGEALNLLFLPPL